MTMLNAEKKGRKTDCELERRGGRRREGDRIARSLGRTNEVTRRKKRRENGELAKHNE